MTNSRDDDVLRQFATTTIWPRWWFKSHASNGTCACVEVRFTPDRVMIRDSKYLLADGIDPDLQPIISVSVDAWLGFLDEVAGNAAPGINGELIVDKQDGGTVSFFSSAENVRLTYTSEEWTAFVLGVEAGEFVPQLEPV